MREKGLEEDSQIKKCWQLPKALEFELNREDERIFRANVNVVKYYFSNIFQHLMASQMEDFRHPSYLKNLKLFLFIKLSNNIQLKFIF